MKQTKNIYGLRPFLTLWAGQSVSTMGSAMTSYALLLWVYGQEGTVLSIALLSVFSNLPSILFSFIAGSIADRWNKKRVMLACDALAALGTLVVLIAHGMGALSIGLLYVINFIISFMNAFQGPAAYVAVTLLTPPEHYARASGLHAFSRSITTIITPALAAVLMAAGGITLVLAVDLLTFAVGFLTLLFFVPIPPVMAEEKEEGAQGRRFLSMCLDGLRFLRSNRALLSIILFFSFINLIAYISGLGGVLPAMVLARSGGSEAALALVTSCVGIGALAGSVLVTLSKPQKRRSRAVFVSCGVSFLCADIVWGIGRTAPAWAVGAFFGNLVLPFLNANLTSIMRTKVPVSLQGRVFSTRDTLQYATIPLGTALGGLLADRVFEPFMAGGSAVARALSALVGEGPGAGMAVIFLITGILGSVSSFWSLRNRAYQELDA